MGLDPAANAIAAANTPAHIVEQQKKFDKENNLEPFFPWSIIAFPLAGELTLIDPVTDPKADIFVGTPVDTVPTSSGGTLVTGGGTFGGGGAGSNF